MNISNPIYALAINSTNCQIEIRCNDVIVFEFKGKSTANKAGVSITVPINQFILRNGNFDIRGSILPIYGSKILEMTSYLRMKLVLFDANSPIKTRIELLDLKTPQKADNEKADSENPIKNLKKLPRYELYRNFKAEKLPFNEIGWFNSIDLSELSNQKLLKELYHFYQKIYSIINSGNINDFSRLVQNRDKILINTFYFNSIKAKGLIQEMVTYMNDKTLTLLPLPPINILKIDFMGNNKLLRLVRQNDLPIIIFYNPGSQRSVKLDFKFHKKTSTSEFSII